MAIIGKDTINHDSNISKSYYGKIDRIGRIKTRGRSKIYLK